MIPAFSELHAKTQRDRIDFLQTDLALCFTFMDLADTELGSMKDRDAALRVMGKAEEGHATISHLLLNVDDGPQKDTIQEQLAQLRARLDSFHQQMHATDSSQTPATRS